MPSEKIAGYLKDILHHIDLAAEFVSGSTAEQFEADVLRVYAVTRRLEIISEASRRLPGEIKTRHPSIPWRDVAGTGNIYRHDYDNVAAARVWETVQVALPPLRSAIERELSPDDHARP
jgi:uncharacterized protein with HEPN domain